MRARIVRAGVSILLAALCGLPATALSAQLGTPASEASGARAQPGTPGAVSADAAGAGSMATVADRLEAAVASLRTHQDTSGVAGLSAAIAVDGRLRWAGGFGWADLQARLPMGPETVSRIGSISKPVAAAATMALVDRGALDLDAPVSRYLPDYPRPHADRMTTRQLMSHTAGIRHYRGDEFLSNVAYDDVFGPMEVFWADSLLFEPGTEYNYSTYGWTVVSAVTAAAADRPFVDVLRDEVVRPLGLLHLRPEWQDSVIPNHARFYMRGDDGAYLNAPEVDQSNKWAGGGLVSTASDLVNFALGLMHDDLLSDAALAESWTRQTPEGEASYGLGWRVAEVEGHPVVSHSGGSMGATAMLIVLPDDGIVVSILGNTGGVGHGGAAMRAARILLGLDSPDETTTEDA